MGRSANGEHLRLLHPVSAFDAVVVSRGGPSQKAQKNYADVRSYIKTHHFTDGELKNMKQIEGLDYVIMENAAWWKQRKSVTPFQFRMSDMKHWIVVFIVAVLTGIVSYSIHASAAYLLHYKYEIVVWISSSVHNSDVASPFLMFWACNVVLGVLSCLFVILLSPIAAGSGVPVSIGYLNGSRIPRAFNVRTVISRVFSTVLAGALSLSTATQDPVFHIGGLIGGGVGEMRSRTLGFTIPIFKEFRNSRARRDFIAAGVAAGLSASLGSPIGGILFVMEQVAAVWSGKFIWRTFFGCAIAAFSSAWLLSGIDLRGGEMYTKTDAVFDHDKSNIEYHAKELIPFIAIGLGGGLLGSLFNWIHKRILLFRRDIFHSWSQSSFFSVPKKDRFMCVLDVIIVVSVVSIAYFYLQSIFSCRIASASVSKDLANKSPTDPIDWPPSPQRCHLDVQDGMNPLGMLLLGRPDNTLRHLFSSTYTVSTPIIDWFSTANSSHSDESDDFFDVLWPFFIIYFCGTLLMAGCSISSGLIMPVVILGAAYGRQMGYWVHSGYNVHVYALVGAAGMLAGVTRLPLTSTMILISMANDIQYLCPVMLSVLGGRWVGDLLNNSIFRTELGFMGIPYLYPDISLTMEKLTVKDCASKPAVCLPTLCKVELLVKVLNTTTHNGFPVVDCESEVAFSEEPKGPVIGLILKRTLLQILNRKMFVSDGETMLVRDDDGSVVPVDTNHGHSPSFSKQEVTVDIMQQMLSEKMVALADIALSEEERAMYVDLQPFMNQAPITVNCKASMATAFRLFMTMGLRHLPVMDKNNKCAGMLTRRDFLEDILQKTWRAKVDRNNGRATPTSPSVQ
eukprot:ANDGO_04464.mRNA.1 Chloride channel protein C